MKPLFGLWVLHKNQSPCFRSGALSYRGWSGESQGHHSEPEAHSLSTLTLKVHFVEVLNQWSVPRGNELWIPTPFNPHLTSDSLVIQYFQSAVKMSFRLRSICERQGLFLIMNNNDANCYFFFFFFLFCYFFILFLWQRGITAVQTSFCLHSSRRG